jgi:uncharacterized protein YhbP (UPF0306 family)
MHSQLLRINPHIAGSILPDKRLPFIQQGVQFKGIVREESEVNTKNAQETYHKRHPLGLTRSGEIWIIQMDYIQMTDNTLGLSKILCWERVLQEFAQSEK